MLTQTLSQFQCHPRSDGKGSSLQYETKCSHPTSLIVKHSPVGGIPPLLVNFLRKVAIGRVFLVFLVEEAVVSQNMSLSD